MLQTCEYLEGPNPNLDERHELERHGLDQWGEALQPEDVLSSYSKWRTFDTTSVQVSSSGRQARHFVLELLILLPHLCARITAMSCHTQFYVVLRIQLRAFCIQGKQALSI